jgi:hypothetical protein
MGYASQGASGEATIDAGERKYLLPDLDRETRRTT